MMPLEKINIYTAEITAQFVVKAKNDADALTLARAWIAEYVTRLNYALTRIEGYEVPASPAPAP